MKVIYKCKSCGREFEPDEVPDMEEFCEEGDWQHLCPDCRTPLKWIIK